VQTARYGATYPALLNQEQLHLLLSDSMIAKKVWAGSGCRCALSVCSGGFLVDLQGLEK